MYFKFTELMVNLPPAKAKAGQPAIGLDACGCTWTVVVDPHSDCTWVTEEATGEQARQAAGSLLPLLRAQLQQAAASSAA